MTCARISTLTICDCIRSINNDLIGESTTALVILFAVTWMSFAVMCNVRCRIPVNSSV